MSTCVIVIVIIGFIVVMIKYLQNNDIYILSLFWS